LKRFFDAALSGVGLVLLCPVFVAVAIGIKLTSSGPVFFRQKRMGKDCKSFCIFKFRTMRVQNTPCSCQVTACGDTRITPFGRFLRRHKLDELPQLINVLRGEMSLVGPRPEVLEFVEIFSIEYARLLKVRPGITHPITLRFRREEDILASNSNPRDFYVNTVLPRKLAAYEADLEHGLLHNFWTIVETLLPVLSTVTPYGPNHFSPARKPAVPFTPVLVQNIPAMADEESAQVRLVRRAQEA
jgi:lipopolysaccharide/colanic/teichoic acid biosynthesis glycosyltransferase